MNRTYMVAAAGLCLIVVLLMTGAIDPAEGEARVNLFEDLGYTPFLVIAAIGAAFALWRR